MPSHRLLRSPISVILAVIAAAGALLAPGLVSAPAAHADAGAVPAVQAEQPTSVIANADGRLEVFGVGTGSALGHIAQSAPGNWSGSGSAPLGGSILPLKPAAVISIGDSIASGEGGRLAGDAYGQGDQMTTNMQAYADMSGGNPENIYGVSWYYTNSLDYSAVMAKCP
jgi:hypothetical protein